MTESQIDALVFAALSDHPEFHAWLVNNYLQTPRVTYDPNEALVINAQAVLVASLNIRYARHMNNAARTEPDPAGARPEPPASNPAAERLAKHFRQT